MEASFKGDHSKMTMSGQFVMKYSSCCQRSFFSVNLSTFDPLKLRCGIFTSFEDGVFVKQPFKKPSIPRKVWDSARRSSAEEARIRGSLLATGDFMIQEYSSPRTGPASSRFSAGSQTITPYPELLDL